MKILLISDTHGTNIDRISAYAEELRADVCVHAGDFGFYDTTSVDAMSQRELYLLVKHSALPDEEKAPLLKGNAQDWKAAVVEKRLLGMFPDFLADKMRFGWPVYATWGNHDDADVVQRMIKAPVANLRMLHETAFYDLGDFILLGVGGNCTPGKAFTAHCSGLPGARCRPSSVLSQYAALLQTAKRIPAGRRKVLVTHVSPLVEPFIELVAWQIGADVTVSGHMGRKNGEIGTTDSSRVPALRQTYEDLLRLYPKAESELLPFYPEPGDHVIRHINLPDAKDGYGALEYADWDFRYEIRGEEYWSAQKDRLGEELYGFSREFYRFVTLEYSAMLPVADKIIAGETSADDELYYTERMLHCLGYKKMSELLHKCCESIMKRNPEFAIDLLDSEHEMMEGSEAAMPDELRREYDFHKGKKNPYVKKQQLNTDV